MVVVVESPAEGFMRAYTVVLIAKLAELVDSGKAELVLVLGRGGEE